MVSNSQSTDAVQFEQAGVSIKQVYHCPFHADGVVPELTLDSDMRKPKPGMLLLAQEDHGLDMQRSIMVGDKESDIEAGKHAEVGRTVRLASRLDTQSNADIVIQSIADLPMALGWHE